MSYRSEFAEAKKALNWTAAEKILGQLILVADVEDSEYDELQRKVGEAAADRMNKQDEISASMKKKLV